MVAKPSKGMVTDMAASPDHPLHGGCLCGAVRYELSAEPHDLYHCHCSICRKCQGALYPAYASVVRSGFVVTQGADRLSTFDSSAELHRHFCSSCGSHVYGEMEGDPDTISFSVGTLDDGADPGGRQGKDRHIFWGSRMGWYEPSDGLPSVDEF